MSEPAVFLDHEPAARLALDELRLALKNTRPNKWMIPIFTVLICLMFSHWLPIQTLAVWIVLVIAGLVPMQFVARAFLSEEQPASELPVWRTRIVIANLVFTLCWASMGPFLWVPGASFNHVMLLLILCSSLAGDSALMSASRPLSITGSIVYGAVIVALPLREGGFTYDMLALLSLFYAIYMFHLSGRIHETAHDMLQLRNDKNDLIEALAKSKEESDAARERAEAASRSKSEFLANMSHELRTPLNAILGFSEMIYSGAFGVNVGKHVEYSRIIHTSGHHLLALINDILDLAKIEAGGLDLRKTDFYFAALAGDCVKLLGTKASDGALDLRTEIAGNIPKIHGDERALRQVILNLLSNAVKFTPPGGRVTIFARVERDGCLAFGVTDTGLGIADDDQARVFQNFGQGRHDVVTADKGTGLGLPIVRGLVEAHGGHVTLASAVGDGTTVTVVLPASCVAPATPLAAAS